MKAFLLILLIFLTATAQTLRVGATTSYADKNITYGVTAGGDIKAGKKLILSTDFDGFHLCKHAGNGGCGYEYSVRGLAGYLLSDKLVIQGGAVRSQYKVERYGKSSNQFLVGTRYAFNENLVSELNYRHDLTSPNHSNFLELRATKYTKQHLFIRGNWVLETLRNSGSDTITGSLGFAFGRYW